MKKPVLSQHELGSAEHVVAHAAWQRSRGRNPSMSFVGQRNPRRALALATFVARSAQRAEFISSIGAAVVQRKSYYDMTDLEIKLAARHIITSSSSEAEVKQRFRDELGYPYDIELHTSTPTDETGREARELVRGLGGLMMKNGTMVMAMIHGHDNTIIL